MGEKRKGGEERSQGAYINYGRKKKKGKSANEVPSQKPRDRGGWKKKADGLALSSSNKERKRRVKKKPRQPNPG